MATTLTIIGENATKLWGISSRTRIERIAAAHDRVTGGLPSGRRMVADCRFAFDPQWFAFVADRDATALTLGGQTVLANARSDDRPEDIRSLAYEDGLTIYNHALRKRERPFLERLVPENVTRIERASYFAAYKGVTDLLTKYLWPEAALVLTRWAARMGATPNMITGFGALLCVVATVLFWQGHYWPGLAAGLLFMVLDTVDGKLARCTITSSEWGNILDHGIDLVHPPFWWWAWGAGLASWGLALPEEHFLLVLAVIIGGYVVQRLIEGAFIGLFDMHIHVWQRIDSRFRLITARRNPNMVILTVSLVFGRPDIGLELVACWTILSCLFHLVRLLQALAAHRKGPLESWLAGEAGDAGA